MSEDLSCVHTIGPKSFQLLIVFFPKSLGPLLIASNTTLSSLLDKHALIVNKLSRRHADCSLHRTLGFLVLPPSVHFDPPSAMLKTSGNVLSLLLTGPPSSLSATNTTSSSSSLPKKSTKYSSLVSSASDNPKLALHSQTTSLLFSQAKYLHSVFYQQPCCIISAFTLSSCHFLGFLSFHSCLPESEIHKILSNCPNIDPAQLFKQAI